MGKKREKRLSLVTLFFLFPYLAHLDLAGEVEAADDLAGGRHWCFYFEREREKKKKKRTEKKNSRPPAFFSEREKGKVAQKSLFSRSIFALRFTRSLARGSALWQMLLLAQQHQRRGIYCAAVLLSALRATATAATTTTMASNDAKLMSSSTTGGTAAPPPPPALASPGPCGVSEFIHGTVEASNTGDLLKATLVLPTRDNASAPGLGSLPLFSSSSLPLLFSDSGTLAADAAAARCSPPYPLVAFFSGFQARASSYDFYARHLASWGYAVVRYDSRFLSITPDNRELGWLSDVVSWAMRTAPAGTLTSASPSPSSSSPSSSPSSSSSTPQQQQQPDVLFTAGHSRGAKLAALQYAGSLEFARCGGGGGVGGSGGGANSNDNFLPQQPLTISSAFLIDPVDNTRFTPASEAYPSAAAALRAQGAEASLAIAAAGKIGSCNPFEAGYNHFWPSVSGDASFLLVFSGAGHATFNDAGKFGNKLADWLCGSGDLKRETALPDTGAAMVSWFDSVVARVRRSRAREATSYSEENAGAAVSVSLDSDGSNEEGGEERVRVLIAKKRPAPLDAAVPSPSTAALQENFLSWARAAEAAGQVEFEVRGGVAPPQPAPQPAPCPAAAAAGATANNAVPFPLSSSLLKKEEEKAPVAP